MFRRRKPHRGFDIIAGIIFAVVAILHLIRALSGWELVVSGGGIPLWLSWVVFVVFGLLSLLAFRYANK